MGGPYFKLSIWSTDMLSEIWVGDEDGNFVAKDIGWLNEGLEAGTYVVQIGSLKAPKHYIDLEEDLHITEKQLESMPMTSRRFIRKAAELLQKTWIIVALGIICFLATKDLWAAEAMCATSVDPVTCVVNQVKVGDDVGKVFGALGLPVSTFEGIACPPGKTPGAAECITKQVSVHILGEFEFVVAYSAGVVETVDSRPTPDAHRYLMEQAENPFK